MIRLTGVELRRLFARRLTKVAILVAVVVTGLALYATYDEAKPLSAVEQQQAREGYEQALREFETNGQTMVAECRAAEAQAKQQDPSADYACDRMQPREEDYGKPDARFQQTWRGVLGAMSYLFMFVAFLIGSGFIASEISTGSLGTWLTFEPRRIRVYASKLLAAGVGLLPVAVLLTAATMAGAYLIIGALGDTTMEPGQWGQLLATSGRSVLLTVAAAVGGAALGALLRHTAAAMGVAVGYLIVVEGMFGGLVQRLQPWLVRLNLESWLMHGSKYYENVCSTGADNLYTCEGVERTLSFTHASVYLGVALLVLIVGTGVLFHRRDVA